MPRARRLSPLPPPPSQGGALLFQGITFDDITFSAFMGERGLRWLAKKVVQITPQHKTEDELVALFRHRMQPISTDATKIKSVQVSVFLMNEALWVLLYAIGFPFAIIPVTAMPLFHAIYFLA